MEQEDPPCAGCVAAGRQPTPPCCLSHGGQRGSGRSSQGAAVSPTELLSKQDPYLWLCESPDRTPISSGMKVFLPVLLAALLGVERGEMPPPPPPAPGPGRCLWGSPAFLLDSPSAFSPKWCPAAPRGPSGPLPRDLSQMAPRPSAPAERVTPPRWSPGGLGSAPDTLPAVHLDPGPGSGV